MKKKKGRVKHYSQIYKNSARKIRLPFLIIVYFFSFIGIATVSYLATMAVNSFLNRPHCTEIKPVDFADYNETKPKKELGVKSKSVVENVEAGKFSKLKLSGVEFDIKNFAAKGFFDRFLQKAQNDKKNAVIICLKGPDGKLVYDSNLETANEWKSILKTGVNFFEVVQKIKDANLVPIARISAFLDQTAAKIENDNTFVTYNSSYTKKSGKAHVFKGFSGIKSGRWLDATNPSVLNYIRDIAVEAVNFGFEHVLIDNACFPVFKSDREPTNFDEYDDDLKLKSLCRLVKELENKGVSAIFSYPAKAMVDGALAAQLFGGIDFLNQFKKHAPFFSSKAELNACEETLTKMSSSVFFAPEIFKFLDMKKQNDYLEIFEKCLVGSNLLVK